MGIIHIVITKLAPDTCLGIILTTSWLTLFVQEKVLRVREALAHAGASIPLGSAWQAAGWLCLEAQTSEGNISALFSPQTWLTQHWITARSPCLDLFFVWEEPGPGCVFDLTDPKGQVNKCDLSSWPVWVLFSPLCLTRGVGTDVSIGQWVNSDFMGHKCGPGDACGAP